MDGNLAASMDGHSVASKVLQMVGQRAGNAAVLTGDE
jgi:hypothetical protein